MASSSKATGQHWWLGWYALAYVPDELQEEEGEKLKPAMTKLTENGDIIYNIFQGDMNGDGYQTTKASSRFKSVNYDSNIKKNYRYVLDESGRNNLVTFVDGKHGLKGACVYKGVQVVPSRDDNEIGHENSKIPLPAPLLYTGVKAAGEGWSETGMNIFLGSGNDSIEKFYPVEEVGGVAVPRVSTDFRNYEGYKNGLPKPDSGNEYEDGLDEFNDPTHKVDSDGWTPSVYTYTQNDETGMDKDYNQYCLEYWKVLSISNFNKYCAPVNAAGLLYDENTGCRNMSKATKYFPISDYSVTSTAKTADNEYATGIKLKVQLKLNGNAEDGSYFKDVETGSEGNVATLNPLPNEEEQALFNTQQVSFRFNRIGIYAVPMRQYGCSGDEGEMKAQFQIDTEAEPVLFAVCEWDSPVTLSDSGEGLSEFQSDIFIDLSAAVEDSSVIRESAVFYNLYEDDAIDWYKNQLVANASIAEALVNMQIEMGYLRNQKNAKQGCCPKQEAIQQQKSSNGLRNLVDAKDYNSNSVRNRLAQVEGTSVNPSWSDTMPKLGAIGYPHLAESTNAHIYARKSSITTPVSEGSDEVTTTDKYVALYCDRTGGDNTPSDAEIDRIVYEKMAQSSIQESTIAPSYTPPATRIGGFWVRRRLYYELFSLKTDASQPNTFAWDYDDNVATNDYVRTTGKVTDYMGDNSNRVDCRNLSSDDPHITIVMVSDGNAGLKITTYDDSTSPTTITDDYPTELNNLTDFAKETNRPITPYETKRTYIVYYRMSGGTREYTYYKIKRTTDLSLPKAQLYKTDKFNVYPTINQHLAATGWRIPTTADWNKIIDALKTEPEKINEIRSGTKWAATGGTGEVYPLGGAKSSRTSTDLVPNDPVTNAPVIYLAIADDDVKVVTFDGTSFEITDKPSVGQESSLTHVGILCVADAVQVSDKVSNYKLGNDSYALMEGSVTQGNHNFNAGEKSAIFANTNYVSIFGGMYNTVNNSDYTSVLNGHHNSVLNTVFSAIFGDDNLVQGTQINGYQYNTCGVIAATRRSVITGCATSSLVIDQSRVQTTFAASILAEYSDIKNAHYSLVAGRNIYNNDDINFSEVFALESYHLPKMSMSKAVVVYDHCASLPSALKHDSQPVMEYSELTGYGIYFCGKSAGTSSNNNNMRFSRIIGGGSTIGIVSSLINYSDVFANNDGSSKDSRASRRTLESVNSSFSRLVLCNSSIMSHYVDSEVKQSEVNFSDVTLCNSLMLMSDTSSQYIFSFGVARLSGSILSQCNCSYVYESGTEHYLTSTELHYSTLVGRKISMEYKTLYNTHIYGSLHLGGISVSNHIILAGLSGTSVGSNSADNYIAEFGTYISENYKGYPMIWSMGGLGLFMNKMILGDNGVASADKKEPSIGDVLSVVSTEGNMATVAWKSGSGVGGGNSGTCIITDFDVYEGGVPQFHSPVFYGLYSRLNAGRTLVLHSGATDFSTIVDDTKGPLSGNGWTYDGSGSSWYESFPWFRFKSNENRLDIYTWFAYKGVELVGTQYQAKWYVNNRWTKSGGYDFGIMGNDLREGVVYEVNIHVVSLPPTEAHAWDNSIPFNDWASPISEKVASGTKDSQSLQAEIELEILFSGLTTASCATWGAPDGQGSTNPRIVPSFRLPSAVSDNNDCGTYTSRTSGRIFDTIAEASVQFVRLGNKVYLMSY